MHEQVTHNVALPIARRDDGTLVEDFAGAVECTSREEAILLAAQLRMPRDIQARSPSIERRSPR